ncbi:hypothetical protein F4804DRAFT_352027 [Jackrogersella minutella]|nr:hypothetical protein F4804DRAFT_352027 [Jackrogersella minutella]
MTIVDLRTDNLPIQVTEVPFWATSSHGKKEDDHNNPSVPSGHIAIMPKRRGSLISFANEGRLVLPRRSRRGKYIRQRREEAARLVIPVDEERAGEAFDRIDSIAPLGGNDSGDDDIQMSDNESMAAQASGSDSDIEGVLDIADLDLDVTDEVVNRDRELLPPGFDQQELNGARDYNDFEDDAEAELPVAFDEGPYGVDHPVPAFQLPLPGVPPAALAVSGRPVGEDPSTLHRHHQNQFLELSDFELAYGIYAHIFGLNRTQYASLSEVMALIKDDGGDDKPINDVEGLPNQLATLKDRVSRRFPLLDTRTAQVPLAVVKLPSEKASRKQEELERSGKPMTAELTIIDPVSLFTAFMSSSIAKDRMHMSLANFVDEPKCEIDVVFPSEFVMYTCCDEACGCQEVTTDNPSMAHLGRVYGVGKDYRTAYCTRNQGEVALQIQEVFGPVEQRPQNLVPPHPLKGQTFMPLQDESELILNLDVVFVPKTRIIQRVRDGIACDYYWGESMDDPSPPLIPKQTVYPKYEHRPQTEKKILFVRRAISEDHLIPLCHTHPIRAELELMTYGRSVFEKWDEPDVHVVSCPNIILFDGFGVYRNSYRSLVGVYAIPVGLDSNDRHRPENIFPLTLCPHGSNFEDTVGALQSLGELDCGVEVEINGENVVLCVPTLCYIGDMPQQDKNSGFRGPKAHKPCRFCLIGQKASKSGNPNDILDFDVVTHGRYHYQTLEMRKCMANQSSNAKTKGYATQWGLAETEPALPLISPALDLILSRPPDPAHSEYQGLTELMHSLFIDRILQESGRQSYARTLRLWPFPPGWQRLQSPLHHLRSYSLSSHARWSVIIPALLRSWLSPAHIHPHFMVESIKHKQTEQGVVDFVVYAFATLAKSNSVLMGGKISADDRKNLNSIVRATREVYQKLCQFTSQSIVDNPRAYSRFGSHANLPQRGRGRGRGSGRGRGKEVAVPPPATFAMAPPPVPGPSMAPPPPPVAMDTPITSIEDPSTDGPPKRATQYLHDQTRPNVHVGIHYPMIAEEYALPANVNVLLGENQHRWFKKKVYETNYSNIEKLLLAKSNMQITIRFLLQDAFFHRDSELTLRMQRLYNDCPTLFESVLPRTEIQDMPENELDFELDANSGGDYQHRRATVIGHVHLKGTTHVINEGRALPTRHVNMTDRFKHVLRQTYVRDYGQPDIYQFAGVLQYANKFGFSDR